MHSDVDTLFRALWEDYRAVTPSADRIHGLLAERENTAIVNDHIALRTFNLAPVGLDALAAHFLALGYQPGGEYHFEARSYTPGITSTRTRRCQKCLSPNCWSNNAQTSYKRWCRVW